MHPVVGWKVLRALWRMRRGRPTFVSFNVTNRCNARCPMCVVWRTPCEELTLPELERIFRQMKRAGFCVIEISGGEPFLREDLFDIFALLDRLGFLYTVTSNGGVITEAQIARLPSARGLLQVGISLDSLKPEVYERLRGSDALARVLENVERLRRSGLKASLKLNFTMSRLNYTETLDVLGYARSKRLFMSAFPVNQGEGFCHRSGHSAFRADDEDKRQMRDRFLELARLRRSGEPLWEYSGFYELAAEFVAGKGPGPCDAGRLFIDMHADGRMAVCIDQPPIADLRSEPLETALSRLPSQGERIGRCAEENPCFYTCTTNISMTARHELAFILETLKVRLVRAVRG